MHVLKATRPHISRLTALGMAARRHASSSHTGIIMKVLSSLKSAKKRDKNCRVVRRKGRLYVINKQNPRMKARQG